MSYDEVKLIFDCYLTAMDEFCKGNKRMKRTLRTIEFGGLATTVLIFRRLRKQDKRIAELESKLAEVDDAKEGDAYNA